MPGKFLIGLTLLLMPVFALALEYKSIGTPKAILYDGPSIVASKRYILSQLYPVEVVVKLTNWTKVRDAEGGLHWLESKALSDLRTVIIKDDNVQMHESTSVTSAVLGVVQKQVVLMLEDTQTTNGWLKVKSIKGVSGYVPVSAVWGF